MQATRAIAWLLLLALLVGCGSGKVFQESAELAISAAPWEELSIPEAGIRIEMPRKPKRENSPEPGSHIYKTESGGRLYEFIVRQMPPTVQSQDAARNALLYIREHMIGSGQVSSESHTEFNGHPAEHFEVKTILKTHAIVRMYSTDRHIVIMVLNYRELRPTDNLINKYFGSLRIESGSDVATQTNSIGSDTPDSSAAHSGSMSSRPPENAVTQQDRRVAWRYENAPKVFSDQRGFSGLFRYSGNGWTEQTSTGVNQFTEVSRNDEYIELQRGTFRMRLYNDHSEYQMGGNADWKQMYPGRWE